MCELDKALELLPRFATLDTVPRQSSSLLPSATGWTTFGNDLAVFRRVGIAYTTYHKEGGDIHEDKVQDGVISTDFIFEDAVQHFGVLFWQFSTSDF